MKSSSKIFTRLAAWIAFAATPLVSAAGEPAMAKKPEAAIILSPFTVATDKDDGFSAANAGTATRMSLEMQDVPAPYSVMTREFIDALNITNIAEAASWMPNGNAEAAQDLVQQPMMVGNRGVGSSGQQRNGYLTAGLLESYSLERYEFGRGPNAALFNIGGQSALNGGLGGMTKRPRYDRQFDTVVFTYGSWDYKRSTLDVNRPLTDKLAVRGNAVWFDRNGWRMREFETLPSHRISCFSGFSGAKNGSAAAV